MNSQQGASLMIALLFFLVCAIVGSVVLTAATVTSKRNSSANTDANRRRYAIMSAEDVITNQLKGTSDDGSSFESFAQNWSFLVTSNDDGSYTIDTSSGAVYVPAAFSTTEDASGTSSSSASTGSGSGSAASDKAAFSDLRKEMAEKIISHYWPYFTAGTALTTDSSSGDSTGASSSSTVNEDPWDEEYPLTDWDQIVTGSGSTYSVKSGKDSPLTITLNNASDYPTVYADLSMDSSFNLTIHLYCKSDSSSNLVKPGPYLAYNASDVDISYESGLPATSATGSKSTVNRSIQINISWDQPIITTDSSQLQSDTQN